MYRAPRAFAAALAGFGLTACQLTPPTIQGTVEAEPTIATPPAAVIVEQETPIAVAPAPKVSTVTVIERQDSPGLKELSEFIAEPKLQRARLLSLRNDYKVNKSPTNALRLGAALSVVGTTDKPLSEAIRLLKTVPSTHDEHALATLMLDQAQKRISMVNTKAVVAAPKVAAPKVIAKTVTPQGDDSLVQREQDVRQREIEVDTRERGVASIRGENARLRIALDRAEQKLRELAQIEDELAKPQQKRLP